MVTQMFRKNSPPLIPNDAIEAERLVLARMRPLPTFPSEHRCPQCSGELRLATEHTERGTGVIVILIGILLAPCLLGIPILVYGLVMVNRIKSYRHCRMCGRTFPT